MTPKFDNFDWHRMIPESPTERETNASLPTKGFLQPKVAPKPAEGSKESTPKPDGKGK